MGDQSLLDLLKVRLPTFMLPAHVTWRDSLPRNPNGKIDRKRLSLELVSLFEGTATWAQAAPRSASVFHQYARRRPDRRADDHRDGAREIGRTPFYVYSRDALGARVSELRQALPRSVHLHYAIKANPMPELVRHMSGLVDGLDVASAGELRVALATDVAREHVSFAGPGKRDDELQAALDAGITVNLESEQEMERLARMSAGDRRRARVAVRVNPDFQLKSSGMKMGGGAQRFRASRRRVPQMLTRPAPARFRRLHLQRIAESACRYHRSAAQGIGSASSSLAIAGAHCAAQHRRRLRHSYFPGGRRSGSRRSARGCASVPASRARSAGSGRHRARRYLVGEAGLVCRVIDRKISRGRVFLITDGGLHHHLAASGNFGQVLRKNYPVVVASKVRGTERGSPLSSVRCTPLDLLADQMDLARAEAGDLIAVFQSGAYGLTASPTAFLGHPPPGERLI